MLAHHHADRQAGSCFQLIPPTWPESMSTASDPAAALKGQHDARRRVGAAPEEGRIRLRFP